MIHFCQTCTYGYFMMLCNVHVSRNYYGIAIQSIQFPGVLKTLHRSAWWMVHGGWSSTRHVPLFFICLFSFHYYFIDE